MNQNLPLPPILPLCQRSLNPSTRALELAQQVLILHIIDLDPKVFVLLEVGDALEVKFQDREHVRDTRVRECGLAPEGEDTKVG